MRELELQRKLIELIKWNNGFATKVGDSIKGTPDLMVCIRSIGMMSLEIKHLKGKKPGFRVQNPATDKQIRVMKNINEANKHGLRASGILVFVDIDSIRYLVGMPPDMEYLTYEYTIERESLYSSKGHPRTKEQNTMSLLTALNRIRTV